jgi:hypothetical protein
MLDRRFLGIVARGRLIVLLGDARVFPWPTVSASGLDDD